LLAFTFLELEIENVLDTLRRLVAEIFYVKGGQKEILRFVLLEMKLLVNPVDYFIIHNLLIYTCN
jgi:hypothetical protein